MPAPSNRFVLGYFIKTFTTIVYNRPYEIRIYIKPNWKLFYKFLLRHMPAGSRKITLIQSNHESTEFLDTNQSNKNFDSTKLITILTKSLKIITFVN